MQQQESFQPPEERQYLINRARKLQQSGQTCKIVTKSAHSIITGRVIDADDGGITFEALGLGEQLVTTWSNVAEFVLPQGVGQQSFSQSAGAGGYNYGQQRP